MALGVSASAIRQQLTALERDGILVRRGLRRSGAVGKPAMMYSVSTEAEAALSRAYQPVLAAVFAALPAYLDRVTIDRLLLDVGARLADPTPPTHGSLAQRAQAAAAQLDALGAATTVRAEENGSVVVAGCACPLAAAVNVEPQVCRAVERLLALVTQLDVRERCERGGAPRCRFEISGGS